MGCWNGTCMISNLPIISGEKIKLILLHSHYGLKSVLNTSAYCYPNGILTPAFLALSGEYNDYGGIENMEEDWNYNVITKILKESFGEKIKTDGRITEEDWILEDALEGIERGNLSYFGVLESDIARKKMGEEGIKIYKQSKGWAMMDEKSKKGWEDIANLDVSKKWRNADLSFAMIRQDIWNYVCSMYRELPVYDRERENKSSYGEIPYHQSLERDFARESGGINGLLSKVNDKLLEFNSIFNPSYAGSGKLWGIKTYTKYMFDASLDEKVNIFKLWSEQNYVDSCLSHTRKGWMIQSGAGSQSDCWEDYIKLSEKIIQICKSKLKENGEE